MSRQGLRFNPEKIICWTVKGNNSFFVSPQLSKVDNINHLGAYVGINCNDTHIEIRIGTCRSFYSFQAAEMCNKVVHSDRAIIHYMESNL